MLNRAAEAQLSSEPLLPAGIVGQPRLQNLDRDDSRRYAIECAQDDAAASLADDRLNLITASEQVPRLDLGSPLARDARLIRHGGDAALVFLLRSRYIRRRFVAHGTGERL